jgi:hypothetical protein
MKSVSTSARTWILATTLLLLPILFQAARAECTSMDLPNRRPAGPVIANDGTPFEEPELVPHVPVPPKVPGAPGELPFDASAAYQTDESDDAVSRPSWRQWIPTLWFFRPRF